MERESYHYDLVYVIHDFLSLDECADFIRIGEAVGFGDAPITTRHGPVMRKDVRNNSRVMKDDVELADQLWARAKPWVISPWRSAVAVGLNERFRFYRYEPGQLFAPHNDGAFVRSEHEKSEFTFLIYLNDDFVGGETRFFHPGVFHVKPRTGSLLLFYHPQLHEGAVVESGTKYVLRSDVMYRKQTV
jgi:prolyl 4-hydroxylase